MDKMIYTLLNSMKVVQEKQVNNNHELANVNTTGFKRSYRLAIESRDILSPGMLSTRAIPVSASEQSVDLTPGPMQVTGGDMDVYVKGKGLIAVQGAEGQELYTRRGDLRISPLGLLQTGKGSPVLGDEGPITLPPAQRVEIAEDGTVSILPQGEGGNGWQAIGRIKLVDASNERLYMREDGLYRTEQGTALEADTRISLAVQALEGSNVNTVEAMTQLIQLSRNYEMQVRMLKEAKEIDAAGVGTMRMS